MTDHVLCYTDGPQVPDALRQWARESEHLVRWRNGQLFSGPERRAVLVFTDMDEVAEAYEAEDVEVRALPEVGAPPATEAAHTLADKEDVDLSEIEGTGKDGRVVKSDVEETL